MRDNKMKHASEEQLIEYRYSELPDSAWSKAIGEHLRECDGCRRNYEALARVLEAVDALPLVEPDAGYETRLWNQIEPKLSTAVPGGQRAGAREWFSWTQLFAPRRLAAAASVAVMIAAAFFAGRHWPGIQMQPVNVAIAPPPAPTLAQGKERVLLFAVGDHLDRAQMVLLEISNADVKGAGKGSKAAPSEDITHEQQRAEELLTANRLYRQTAMHTGDNAVASVLDELEPVLLEIAHSPSNMTAADLEQLRKHIEARGLLLKVRVLDSSVRQREKASVPGAASSAL
jgi:hypothetical protein